MVEARRERRRTALFVCVGVVVGAITVAARLASVGGESALPVLARDVPAPTSTTTSTSTTTTTTAPPPPVAAASAGARRPSVIPSNPYAKEPLRLIGSIEIPKIGLVHNIYQGVTLNNINQGPSHWTGTAMPGDVGNSVFAGHRVTHSRPFRNIDQLAPGDLITFVVGGVRSTYRVTGSQIVRPSDVWIANPTPTPTATLYACHPPGSAAYRYVVRAELVR
jgi:sortase A